MPTPEPSPLPTRKLGATDTSEAVDRFMAKLEHPHKDAIEVIRRIMRETDATIAEGVKWNAPSFRTTEYFATTHLRAGDGIGIVLHLGAKARERPAFQIDDPKGLLKWLAKDRALMNFAGIEDVKAHEAAIQEIVRAWITAL